MERSSNGVKIVQILHTKITLAVALLVVVASAICAEQVLLNEMSANDDAFNSLAMADSTAQPSFKSWSIIFKDKIALANVNVPLMPDAKRLTFADNNSVSYRVNATAQEVANFYRVILASQGWKATAKALANPKMEKLSIAYAENPVSKKTNVTFSLASSQVLGVKIAEADMTAPAPAPEPAPAPAPEPRPFPSPEPQPQPFPQPQPMPIPPTDQPGQPMPPFQPGDQPMPNKMEFIRPMQPINGEQNMNQTCRINGADMPGPCDQRDNRGQMMNQGDQKGQQGPSEEEMKKMDEKRFKEMKRGLSQFSNGAKQMKRSIARIKTANAKCGVGMPEELDNALAQTDSLITKINAAQTADELDEIIGDVQDVGSVMQDWGPRMGDLSRLCQMLKQADRDAKQFDRSIKQMESQAKANKKVDISELIAEYKTAVSAQKDVLAQAKELAKTDPDSALEKLQDDFYGNMDNLGNLQMQISAILNVSKGIKDISRDIINFTSQIKALTKKKIDTANLQELLNNLKTQVAEIKTMVSDKVDAEELAAKVDEAFSTRQDLQDALQELGAVSMTPKLNSVSSFNIKVNLPGAFVKSENDNSVE